MWDDDRRVTDEPWQDSETLVLASGVAGLVLIGLLIFAVLRVADSSVDPPDMRYPDTSVATSGSNFTTSTTTTTYSLPRVQTSEFTPPAAGPPSASPSEDGVTPSTAETSTTIYNPYAPPTSTGSAGHI